MSRSKIILAAVLSAACAAPAWATTIVLATDPLSPAHGAWHRFDVDELSAVSGGVEWIDADYSLSPDHGSPLFFDFSIAAGSQGVLTVVDAGFAGDSFRVTNFGSLLGATSVVPLTSYDTAADSGDRFDEALADPAFSRASFLLGAGSYRIGGALDQSVHFDGLPLNATVGGLRLTVSPVPEPAVPATLAAGLFLITVTARLRNRKS